MNKDDKFDEDECDINKGEINSKEDVAGTKKTNETDEVVLRSSQIVVDGDYLHHRVYWKGQTFQDISRSYNTVVFDGYSTTSTKDHEHAQRTDGQPPSDDVFVTRTISDKWK